MPSPITLRQGPLTVDLQPEWGGRITVFRWEDQDIFLPFDSAGFQAAFIPPGGCFPLVPWSNRIRNADLQVDGRTIKLMPSPGEQGHAHHGHGLWNEWSGIVDDQSCVMQYDHPAGEAGWPWAYSVTQTIALTAVELTLTMRLENQSSEPMPFGLGWHPYYPCNAKTQVQYAAQHAWPSAEGQIFPLAPQPVPGDLDRQEEGPLTVGLDQGFSGWERSCRIVWPDRGLALEVQAGETLDYLHVYTPRRRGFICMEPVSHAVDGFNLAERGITQAGRRVLEPGGATTVHVQFRPRPISSVI